MLLDIIWYGMVKSVHVCLSMHVSICRLRLPVPMWQMVQVRVQPASQTDSQQVTDVLSALVEFIEVVECQGVSAESHLIGCRGFAFIQALQRLCYNCTSETYRHFTMMTHNHRTHLN